ncbi:MAG: tRNA (guanosine(46)-N7)-methyltransferase TrmB [Synergistaceae bacterium]|nr:tRNA (guanosine(46)-N7)-methyltransferase TrmB [Synergistaceae bacterium]
MDVLTVPGGRYASILSPRDVPLPLPLDDMARGRRVELEIGFGNGEYTVKYAKARPDVLLFGLEVSPACVMRCAERASREGAGEGLRLIRADARVRMRELFRDEQLDKVFMNFPCPWPKARHAARRVTARDFVDGLAAVLKIGGTFELVTDDAAYADEVRASLGAWPTLSLEGDETGLARDVTTKYERKWLAEGKDIHRLTFVKTGPSTVERRTWGARADGAEGSEGYGLHIRMDRPASEEAVASLDGSSGGAGTAHWAFGQHWAAPMEGAFLLQTFSTDDEFEQRYYIRVSRKGEGGIVQLDRTAGAFLTPAVRGALEDAARRLSSIMEAGA